MESLEEFEKIEQEINDLEFILTGEITSNSGGSITVDDAALLSIDNPAKIVPKSPMLFTEDPIVLKEFEDLEAACEEIAKIKIKATEQEQILKQENQHNNHNDAVEKSASKLDNELLNTIQSEKNS